MRQPVIQCLIITVLFSVSSHVRAESWRLSSRAGISMLYDSNVFESVDNSVRDQAARLYLTLSSRGTVTRRISAGVQYQGAVEGYIQNGIDSRMMHQVHGSLRAVPIKGLAFDLEIRGRDKSFFRADRGYRYLHAQPSIHFSPNRIWTGRIFYTLSDFNYIQGGLFDHTYNGWGASLQAVVSSRVTLRLRWATGLLSYNREAVAYSYINETLFEWINKGEQQLDRLYEWLLYAELYYWALYKLDVGYQVNASNNYGYSFTRPRIHLLIVKSLPGAFTLGLYYMQQWKQYRDSLIPFLQLQPETETEENNYLLLTLDKAITQKNTIQLRWGWYRNESPFRDLYYEKQVISFGFSHVF